MSSLRLGLIPSRPKDYKYVFRAGPSNSGVVNQTIAKWVVAEKFKKAFIVAENSDWGLGIAELSKTALTKAGVQFEVMTTEQKSQDHYTELTKIKAYDPDVVLAYIYGSGLHYFVAQAGEVKLTPKAIILDGAGPPSLWPDYWKNVGDYGNLECFVSSMHEKVELTKLATEYREAYQKAFGAPPTDYKSRSIFDSVLIAADAINRAGATDPTNWWTPWRRPTCWSPAARPSLGPRKAARNTISGCRPCWSSSGRTSSRS